MSDAGRHYDEALQDLLDQRLGAGERTEVEAHVATCARCRATLAALERGRAAGRSLGPLRPPAALTERVAEAVAVESRGERRPPRRRVWIAAASVLAAAALVVLLLRGGAATPDLPAAAAADFTALRDGTLRLTFESDAPLALERFFAERGIDFPTRVFDLGMMGYRLTGGQDHRIAGRRSALYAYAGSDGSRVVCQMYEGSLDELPPAADTREHDGIVFRVYRTGGITLVFWQEGDVVCVLASDGEAEALVLLAYAKAERV